MAEMREIEDARKLADDFNAGAPAETVDAVQLKSFWQAGKELRRQHPGAKATGLGALAGAGFIGADVSGNQLISLMMRASLIDHLLERGVLREFEHDGVPDNAVFRAAATMPTTKNDIGEAMLLVHLQTMPAEEVEKIKAEWLAEGYDANQPRIDVKFLAAVREARRSV